METMQLVTKFVAALCCAIFCGAAIYINWVEHPARMECGSELAATEFAPSYRRATIMQASLAVIGLLCALAAWLTGAGTAWLVGGVLLGLVVPFTLVVIRPTNQRLLDASLDKRSALARELLQRWGRLHAVRSLLSLGALIIFLTHA